MEDQCLPHCQEQAAGEVCDTDSGHSKSQLSYLFRHAGHATKWSERGEMEE